MTTKEHNRKKPKLPENKKWQLPKDSKTLETPIFVRSYLDDYGLDVYEFRILAHVARRDSKHGCYESQAKMAEFCGINQRKVMQALKILCQANILRVERNQKGRTNVYRLNKATEWVHPSELEKIRKGTKIDNIVTAPKGRLQEAFKLADPSAVSLNILSDAAGAGEAEGEKK